ncbi:MAG: tetratricopeptide repeat protein [Bacteroidales bacterium]|nr:tetratricopeptide repeat protein [Bacteroidales bacterium]MDD3666724.1 tetratricopeptide repeat protein [Bacteroidales bacterium]
MPLSALVFFKVRLPRLWKLCVLAVVLASGCDPSAKPDASQVQEALNLADSVVGHDPDRSDSLWKEVLVGVPHESTERGRALLGLAGLSGLKGQFAAADSLFNEVRQIIAHQPDTTLLLGYHLKFGNHWVMLENLDSAGHHFTEGLRLAQLTNRAAYIQGFSISHGQALSEKGDFAEAARVLFDALKTAEKTGNKPHQAVVLQNLALVMSRTGDYQQALMLQQRSSSLKRELNLVKDFAEGLQNSGIFYRNLYQFDSALMLYDSALKVLTALGDTMGLLMVNYNKSVVLKNMKRYPESQALLSCVMATSRRLGVIAGEMYALSALANLYKETGQPALALQTIDSAIAIGRVKKMIIKLPKFLQLRHELLASMNLSAEAYTTLLEACTLSDSLVSAEKQKEIVALNARHQSEKQQAENLMLRNDVKFQAQSLKLHRVAGVLLVVIFILIAAVLYSRMRNAVRQKKMETLKAELLEAASQKQQLALEKNKVESRLKQEELHRLELQNQLRTEELEKLELRTGLQEQELVYQTLARTELTHLLRMIQERLLPFKLRMSRKRDQEEFELLLAEIARDTRKDPLAEFEMLFQQLHPHFFTNLSELNPSFTKNELQIAAMIRLNLNTKDIARLISLSTSAIESTRYHIRRKLNLESGENLTSVLMRV